MLCVVLDAVKTKADFVRNCTYVLLSLKFITSLDPKDLHPVII